jgi:hypothetical protein
MPATSSGRGATAADDGTFELKGLRGNLRIVGSGPRLALKTVRMGTQDILAKPLELVGTEHITDIEVVMTSEVGTIEGAVTNAKGEPAAGAFVLMFSDDQTQWFEASPYIRQSTAATTPVGSSTPGTPPGASPGGASGTPVSPGGSLPATIPGASPSSSGSQVLVGGGGSRMAPGSFSLQTLLPGRYGVVAFERSGNSAPAYDPEALEKLRPRATWVTVRAGESAHAEVRTIKQ